MTFSLDDITVIAVIVITPVLVFFLIKAIRETLAYRRMHQKLMASIIARGGVTVYDDASVTRVQQLLVPQIEKYISEVYPSNIKGRHTIHGLFSSENGTVYDIVAWVWHSSIAGRNSRNSLSDLYLFHFRDDKLEFAKEYKLGDIDSI